MLKDVFSSIKTMGGSVIKYGGENNIVCNGCEHGCYFDLSKPWLGSAVTTCGDPEALTTLLGIAGNASNKILNENPPKDGVVVKIPDDEFSGEIIYQSVLNASD